MVSPDAEPFVRLRALDIPELGASASYLRHAVSGAHILSLNNGDADMSFGIVLRTPLTDSSGVAHILEHAVLHGSRGYPSAAPFVELLRGSLHSHLNASTRRDHTVYLAASRNEADLAAIFDVYFDAVFHPLLRNATFQQEGHGVVYHEMKGHLADPAVRADESLRAALFPETGYRFIAGGEPDEILKLDLTELRAFHTRHYHPSNALFWFSGGGDWVLQLADLDTRLRAFAMRAPSLFPDLQTGQNEPVFTRQTHSGRGDYSIVGWAIPEPQGQASRMMQQVVSDLAASRLQQAFGRSARICNETRQPVFSIGVPGGCNEMLAIAKGELRQLCRDLDHAAIDAALKRLEFSMRNVGHERLPGGLALLDRVAGPWARGCDPVAALPFAGDLEQLRADLETTRSAVSRQIEGLFLDNPHCATVHLSQVDDGAAGSGSSTKSVEPVNSGTSVPALPLSAIPRMVAEYPHSVEHRERMAIYHWPMRTGGITGFDIGFSLAGMDHSLRPYAGLFGRLLLERITGACGTCAIEPRTVRISDGEMETLLFLRLRMLDADIGPVLSRLREWLSVSCSHIHDLIGREIQRLQSQLVQRGHDSVDWALLESVSIPKDGVHSLRGFGQLAFLKSLLSQEEAMIVAELQRFIDGVRSTPLIACNVTGSDTAFLRVMQAIDEFQANLPQPRRYLADTGNMVGKVGSQSFAISSPVNFVGMGWQLPRPISGTAYVALRHVVTGAMWQRVRVQGGAYSVIGRLDTGSGMLRLVSFRDPFLEKTLDAFRQIGADLRKDVSRSALQQAIVGAVGEIDRFAVDWERSFAAMLARLGGETLDMRQTRHEQILSASPDDFHALSNVLEAAEPHVAFLAGQEALERASIALSPDRRLPV